MQASRHRFHKGNESLRRDKTIQETQTNEIGGNGRKFKKGPCSSPLERGPCREQPHAGIRQKQATYREDRRKKPEKTR